MSWPYDVELLTIEPLAVPTGGTEPSVPACKVVITPKVRAPFTALLLAEPTYSEQRSGPTTAKISCVVPDYAHDRLIDADVVIHPPAGEQWVGYVADVDGSSGIVALTCMGAQHLLSRVLPGPLPYCDTRTSEWEQVRVSPWQSAISPVAEGANIRFPIPAGSFIGYTASIQREIPATTALRLQFTYDRPVASCYVQVYVSDGGSWKSVSLSENTSGAKVVNETGTSLDKVLIGLWFDAAYNPTADTSSALISDLKLYGVAGVTSATVSGVLADLASRIPAWTGISSSTHYIEADTTVVEPLLIEADATLLDCIDEIRKFTTNGVAIRSRMVGGEYVPCLVSESYGEAEYVTSERAELTGAGLASLADSARVFYTDAGGRSRYIDVTDSSEDGYLQTIGTERAITLSVPTSSTAVATAYAEGVLASMRQQVPAGAHTVSSYVRDVRGSAVPPSAIHAGRYFRFLDTPLGAVDVLVTEVEHVGGMIAHLGLSGAPLRLDTQIALMGKRQR